MNRTRIALLGIAAVLVAVWVSSATLPFASAPHPAPAPAAKPVQASRPRVSRARDVTMFDLNDAAERLHAHLVAAAHPSPIARNPFEFGQTPAPRVAAPAPLPVVPPTPVGLLPPPFTLTGVAEQKGDAGVQRTAILSGGSESGQIYFAKVGDRLLGRYEVTAVGADAIELREVDGGRIVRLGLR